MSLKALCALLLTANGAGAADFCGVTLDQRNAVPVEIAGSWLGKARSGLMVGADGTPEVLAADAQETLEITLKADGTGLAIKEASGYVSAMALKAFTVEVMAEPDFALPGESPLGSADLLAPEVTEAGLGCNARDLPQFVAEAPRQGNTSATLRLFALTPERLVLVVRGENGAQVARAVIDLTRAAR